MTQNKSRTFLIYALTGILFSGLWMPLAQAATRTQNNRQGSEQQNEEQQRQQQLRNQQQQRIQQQQQQQRFQQQQQQQRFQQQQRHEQMLRDRERSESQRQLQQQQQQRLEQQRRAEELRRNQQRRLEQLRQDQQRQRERDWQNFNRQQRNEDVRRRIYNNDYYRAPHWRHSIQNYEYRRPWEWYSRNHSGRRLITDARWNREFPGLRSYRWFGNGFWYRGTEYRELILFYDDGDLLVAIGFWDRGQFIMIRDDDRFYQNTNPFVLGFINSAFFIMLRF